MFKRILVPLDGSPLAEQAVPVAARLAHVSSGTVIVLQVVDVSSTYGSNVMMQPIITPEVVDRTLSEAGEYLDHLLHHGDLKGVACEKQVVLGHPAPGILSTVDEQSVDLIVMSTHGYTGVKRWVLGSIAAKVAHHAPVPVFLLHDEKPLLSHVWPNGIGSVRALVPLDASARAQDAIAPAAALVAALSFPGEGALHLTQILVVPKEDDKGERDLLLQQARHNLQAISESVREGLVANFGPDLHVTLSWSVSLDSDIAGGIIRVAEDGERATDGGSVQASDLIAMTTHGYGGISMWAMGSIAERVLHATRLPLLLVRPADMLVMERQKKEDTVMQ